MADFAEITPLREERAFKQPFLEVGAIVNLRRVWTAPFFLEHCLRAVRPKSPLKEIR
jgi:hypothetical protein